MHETINLFFFIKFLKFDNIINCIRSKENKTHQNSTASAAITYIGLLDSNQFVLVKGVFRCHVLLEQVKLKSNCLQQQIVAQTNNVYVVLLYSFDSVRCQY